MVTKPSTCRGAPLYTSLLPFFPLFLIPILSNLYENWVEHLKKSTSSRSERSFTIERSCIPRSNGEWFSRFFHESQVQQAETTCIPICKRPFGCAGMRRVSSCFCSSSVKVELIASLHKLAHCAQKVEVTKDINACAGSRLVVFCRTISHASNSMHLKF